MKFNVKSSLLNGDIATGFDTRAHAENYKRNYLDRPETLTVYPVKEDSDK